MISYMQRWRNLSIKCDRKIEEREAVELMMKNMDGCMATTLFEYSQDQYLPRIGRYSC